VIIIQNPGGGGGEGTINVTVKEGEKKYFSLTSGEQIAASSAKTTGWDIGFQRPRTILTNSGETAANLPSGGGGAVWYTDKTDFEAVVLSDAIKTGPLSDYFTDKQKWLDSMSTKQHNTYNVINYAGYQQGNGTEGNPFKTLQYNQKQFYKRGNEGGYPVTNMVYIVRHGDGVHYSKIQVSQYEYATETDIYVIKYKTF
jgi:hypothetical protein